MNDYSLLDYLARGCIRPSAIAVRTRLAGWTYTFVLPFLMIAIVPQWASAQIPDGFEVVRITNDPDADRHPAINSCGQVVYSKRIDQSEAGEEIFLFDNGRTSRITNDDVRDILPDINDHGTVVYARRIVGDDVGIVTVYRNGAAQELSAGSSPSINEKDHISWNRRTNQGCQDADQDIGWYDGQDLRVVIEDDRSNQGSSINDDDWIAWTKYNFCNDPWTAEIMLSRSGVPQVLPSMDTESQVVNLNNLGQVWWGSPSGLEMWENGRTTNITDWGCIPEANDQGEVYFIRWHDDEETWNSWLYADGEFFQLTDSPTWDADGGINNNAEAVWVSLDIERWPVSDIYYMRRIRTGDSEFDGDIDVDDLAKLVDCMTGPMWVERTNPGAEDSLCECRFLDINHDGSVDLRDYAIFQENYAK